MGTARKHVNDIFRMHRQAPRLSEAEEHELLVSWQQQGDQKARQRILDAGMRDVMGIASRYSGSGVPMEDLVAEGTLGLMLAVDRFDTQRGLRLVTYSSHWIRARITRCIIREWKRGRTGMGSTRVLRFFKVRREQTRQLAMCGDRAQSIDETASLLGMSADEVSDVLESLSMQDVSLEARLASEDDGRLALAERLASPLSGPEDSASHNQSMERIRARIEKALSSLDDRERMVAALRLMQAEPSTLSEIGQSLGVSRERVRQIEVAVKLKLSRLIEPIDLLCPASA